MSTITLHLSTIERICAVHKAAADRQQSSYVLSGVVCKSSASTTDPRPGITIAATNGHILVEETFPLESGAIEKEFILSAASVAMLRDWCKAVRKGLGKKVSDPIACLLIENRQATVGVADAPTGELRMMTVDGTFPNYKDALVAGASPFKDSDRARTCLSAEYVGRLEELWGNKRSSGVLMTFARGVLVEPLNVNPLAIHQRGLIMPIALPKDSIR